MLCSAPAEKTGGSSWLNRLRSTKGFPVGDDDDLDLDRFLSQNPNSSSPPPPPPAPTPEFLRRETPWPVAVVTTVLSELFFIGGSSENAELSGKKFPRKQTNPRLCCNNGGGGLSVSSVRVDQIKTSNSKMMKLKRKKKLKKKKKKKKKRSSDFAAKSPASVNSDSHSLIRTDNRGIDEEEEEEEEEELEEDDFDEGEKELRGYSRTEATVIDTSFADWKVERLLFRKKNVWRVVEKRGKPRIFGRKKRKHGDDYCDTDRRVKASSEFIDNVKRPSLDDDDQGRHSKNVSRESNCRAVMPNLIPTSEEVGTDSRDNLGLEFKKRPRLSSLPNKIKKGGSASVIHVKGIPTDRKIVGKPLNSIKPAQKQHKP